jgi:GNAT superfamily N-acetyltransferase
VSAIRTERAIDRLRSTPLRELGRLAWRKAVYRRVQLGRYGVQAGSSVAPGSGAGFTIELWGPDRFDEILPTNPHMNPVDVDDFRRQDTTCIVALDGERIAASTWMTRGQVLVHELHRVLDVPSDEHFSCRSYVDPDYRGRGLLTHLIHAYSAAVPPTDEVWGLVYDWNAASIRSLENLGWRRSGDYWTTFLFGRKYFGERRYAPLGRTVARR